MLRPVSPLRGSPRQRLLVWGEALIQCQEAQQPAKRQGSRLPHTDENLAKRFLDGSAHPGPFRSRLPLLAMDGSSFLLFCPLIRPFRIKISPNPWEGDMGSERFSTSTSALIFFLSLPILLFKGLILWCTLVLNGCDDVYGALVRTQNFHQMPYAQISNTTLLPALVIRLNYTVLSLPL